MNEIQVFNNPAFGGIRTLTIEGQPWFVGKDVALALGYSNTKDALARHVDADDKLQNDGVVIRDPMGREQNPTIINESGLYSLILSSKLPQAKEFKRWVTSEVLPTIRRTGRYEALHTPEGVTTVTHDEYGSIRVLSIDGNLWFVAKDVLMVLGYHNGNSTSTTLKCFVAPEDKRRISAKTVKNVPYQMNIINENGLQSVVMACTLPRAPKVRRWLTVEVLPSLRAGRPYSASQEAAVRVLTPDDYIKAAQIVATCQEYSLTHVLNLLARAGIEAEPTPKEPELVNVEGSGLDTTSAPLIKIASDKYDVEYHEIAKASGLFLSDIYRICQREAYPTQARAAIIRESIKSCCPRMPVDTIVADIVKQQTVACATLA